MGLVCKILTTISILGFWHIRTLPIFMFMFMCVMCRIFLNLCQKMRFIIPLLQLCTCFHDTRFIFQSLDAFFSNKGFS